MHTIKSRPHRLHNRTIKGKKVGKTIDDLQLYPKYSNGSVYITHVSSKSVGFTPQIYNSNNMVQQKTEDKHSNINLSCQSSSIIQHEIRKELTLPTNPSELITAEKKISSSSDIIVTTNNNKQSLTSSKKYDVVGSNSFKSASSISPKKANVSRMQLHNSDLYNSDSKQKNIIENNQRVKERQRRYCCRKWRLGCSPCCCSISILALLLLLSGLAALLIHFLTRHETTTTTTTTTTTSTSATTTTTTTTSTTSTSISSTSTSSTSSTSTTSATTTTADPCAPINIGSVSTIFTATYGNTLAYSCQVYAWTASASGTVTLAFQFRHDPDQWYLDDVSVFDGTNEKIVNGGFETGALSPQWSKSTPSGSCTCCPSATVSGISAGVPTKNGTKYVIDGSNSCVSQISQTFSVTLGQLYTISFWLREGGGSGQKLFTATIS